MEEATQHITRAVPVIQIELPVKQYADTKSRHYASLMQSGTRFPPVSLIITEKGFFRIKKGHHRVAAAIRAGLPTIKAWYSTQTLLK